MRLIARLQHARSVIASAGKRKRGARRNPHRQLFLPHRSAGFRRRHGRRLRQLRRNAGRSRGPQSRFTSRRFLPRSNLKSECGL